MSNKDKKDTHNWTEEEDKIAFYAYRFCKNEEIKKIASKLPMKDNSFQLRIDNFRYLDKGDGLSNFSKQTENVFKKYHSASKEEFGIDKIIDYLLEKDSKSNIKYWALVSNPKLYDIINSLKYHSELWWMTKGKPIEISDQVVIWKSKGNDKDAGVIAFGEIINNPEMVDIDDSGFWIEKPVPKKQLRALIRFSLKPNPPLWKSEHLWFEDLNFVRARGGTVFQISEQQWIKLLNEANSTIEEYHIHSRIGAPFGESEKHRQLKEYIAGNPDLLNLNEDSESYVEHEFITKDRVDVMFKEPNGKVIVVEIEIKGENETIIGAFQAAKYRTLAKMENEIEDVLAYLVAYEIPEMTKELCKKNDIKFLEVMEDDVQNIRGQ